MDTEIPLAYFNISNGQINLTVIEFSLMFDQLTSMTTTQHYSRVVSVWVT